MSKIESNAPRATPWARDASTEVRSLRRAITAGPREVEVGGDVAPMMADLLARPFDANTGSAPRVMPAPLGLDPWAQNPQRAYRHTRGACQNLRLMIQGEADPQKSARLQRMLTIVEEHMSNRDRVISQSSRPE